VKRSGPPRRKTPLRAKNTAKQRNRLASGFQIRRNVPIRPRSAKRISEDAERWLLKKRLLEAFPVCVRCHRERSIDPHEIRRRSQGGSMLDEKIIVMICRRCHEWIHANPLAAHESGWLTRYEDCKQLE
jgi:hypothetical protein